MAALGNARAGRAGLAGLMLAVALATSALAQQWVDLKEGAFAIAMPGPPERSAQEVTVNGTGEVVDQVEFTVAVGSVEFFFSHTRYRKMPANLSAAQMLLNSRDGRSGHLLADRALTVSGAPAREYVHEEDGWILMTRAVYDANTLYQLIVVGRSGVQTAPATRRFFDSFRLIPP
jgi:hypothetical protein